VDKVADQVFNLIITEEATPLQGIVLEQSPFATRMQLLGSLNRNRITHSCTHTSDVW